MCTKEVFDIYLERKKDLSPLDLAKFVCIKQHKGQVRKYTKEPYHTHPFAVMARVKRVQNHTIAMLIASLLHDVDGSVCFSGIFKKDEIVLNSQYFKSEQVNN